MLNSGSVYQRNPTVKRTLLQCWCLHIQPRTFIRPAVRHNKHFQPYPNSPTFNTTRTSASSSSSEQNAATETYYQGTYGPWKVEPEDVTEVLTYRIGLSVAALSFAAGAGGLLFPSTTIGHILEQNGTLIAALGSLGLGVSLVQIHIYVTELKRLVQAFWAAGTLGGIYLALSHGETPLPTYVSENPGAVWLVGPLFAALTGISFKEGLCYGKGEAFILTFAIPILMLGHLSGLLSGAVESGAGVFVTGLLLLFAGRKYTQRIEDDIGDKSVFEFRKLSEDEQRQRILALKAAQQGYGFSRGMEEGLEGDLESIDNGF